MGGSSGYTWAANLNVNADFQLQLPDSIFGSFIDDIVRFVDGVHAQLSMLARRWLLARV